MIRRLQLWQMLGALALFAALSLAPQVASARAGHSHAHAASAAIVAQQAVPAVHEAATQVEQGLNAQELEIQELTAADPAAPCTDHGGGDRNCGANGPCAGCHGFVILPVPAAAPATLSSIVRLDDPPPHLGTRATKLRRPPKSFV